MNITPEIIVGVVSALCGGSLIGAILTYKNNRNVQVSSDIKLLIGELKERIIELKAECDELKSENKEQQKAINALENTIYSLKLTIDEYERKMSKKN